MNNYARLKELANRLIQEGPKANFVSCSETHEISEGVFELIEKITELENVISGMFVQTNRHEGSIRQLYENSVGAAILQDKKEHANE